MQRHSMSIKSALLLVTTSILVGAGCSQSTEPPETVEPPTGVSVVAASPTSARVSWTASISQVSSYNVFRNGGKVGETPSTTFLDAGLTEQTTYKYAVSANGANGQVSVLSADNPSATITTSDGTPPRIIAGTPPPSAVAVPVNSFVTVTFSEPMNASTVASAFTLRVTGSGAAVAGNVTYDVGTRVATLTPGSSLSFATSYTFAVSTAAKDVSGNSLESAFSSAFTTAAPVDATPPTVVSVDPASDANNVAASTVVRLTFSERLNPATVTPSTITLSPSGGSPVSATVALDASGTVATLTPANPLNAATTYSVFAATTIKDVAGNSLASSFASSFRTADASPPPDTDPPSIVSTVPANGAVNIAVTSPVKVTFSEAMTASTINSSSFFLRVNGADVAGSVTYDAATMTATFNPAAGILAEGQSYVATVTTAVKDLAGNFLAANFSFGFTTAAPVDNTPPTIVSRSPAPGATGVPTTTTVNIEFSEPMNASTINGSTLTLSSGGTQVSASVVYNANTRIATLTPAAPLANSQTYTVTITTGARDVAGNSLAATDTYSFTTQSVPQTGITGMTNTTDGWWQVTTADSVGIHFHVVFAQSGSSLSLGPECPGGVNDRCITLAQNAAGDAAIGPPSPGYVWVLLTSVTGTYSGSQITFTMTNANGKTFTFTGTVNSGISMTGTLSGPTLPAESVMFRRPPP